MRIAQTRRDRSLHVIDEEKQDPGASGMKSFYIRAGWLHYAICGEMVGEEMDGYGKPTCKDCLAILAKREKTAAPRFVVQPYEPYFSKSIWVHDTQTDFSFEVDYDDVDHEEVERELERVLALLNA